MRNVNHMDVHKIYDLTVVRLFRCIFNLGPRAPNVLQAPRYLNPALRSGIYFYIYTWPSPMFF